MMRPSYRLPALLLAAAPFAGLGSFASASAADVTHGKAIFQQSCAVCHATGLDPHQTVGQGPLLAGVVGRTSGALASFGYTKALQNAHLTWDPTNLDRFLANPQGTIPGTNMVVSVANSSDREDLIAFLGTLKKVAGQSERPMAHAATPGDWQNDAPGNSHRIVLADLPAPFATRSAGNSPHTVDRPDGAKLSVPAGFSIELFASGLSGPRLLRTAPNGDIFIAETRTGRIRVIRAPSGATEPAENSVFAEDLKGPFGIAFYPAGPDPQWVYIGNLNSVVRFPYHSGDLKATGPAETIAAPLSPTGNGAHTTRDVVFSADGKRLYISVGSGSNVGVNGVPAKSPEEIRAWESAHLPGSDWGVEANRANILFTNPDGSDGLHYFASGIRNPVGIAIQPGTGELWCSTNERDGLGDDLVPDYITHVQEGGYYGWPWYYLGNHEDPRHAGERPDLAGKAIVPDVPVQSHSASLQLTFYPPNVNGPAAFPAEYRGQIFAAFHGSWNRSGRTGSKIIRVILKDGKPTGDYEDFVTGFVIDDSHVWGRPVGVTVANDGALFFTDDANGTLWRVAPTGK